MSAAFYNFLLSEQNVFDDMKARNFRVNSQMEVSELKSLRFFGR